MKLAWDRSASLCLKGWLRFSGRLRSLVDWRGSEEDERVEEEEEGRHRRPPNSSSRPSEVIWEGGR